MESRKVIVLVLSFALAVLPLGAAGKKEKPKTTPTPVTPVASPIIPVPAPASTPPPAVRYYQNDSQITYTYDSTSTMANSGCCFMSCLGVAQTHAAKNLTAEQINTIRSQAYSAGDLDANFWVKNIAGVINRAFSKLGSSLSATVIATEVTYKTIECDSTIIKGMLENGNPHWVEGYANGEVRWNPHPTVAFTTVTKIHFIKITGYN